MKKKLIYFVLAILCFIGFNDNVFANTIKSSDVPNSSYVIGTHMFTREINDDTGYKGQLTTKFIMLAADTINSTNIDDMMIYYKTARGEWIDGISGESVEMPDDIEITNKNASMYLGKPRLTSTLMGYESGYYNYEVYPDNVMEITVNDSMDMHTLYVYEVNDGVISETPAFSKTLGAPVVINVEAGIKKTFVSRLYFEDENGRKGYSDYSDELIIDRTSESFKKPTLTISGGQWYDETEHVYTYDLFVGNYFENGGGTGELDENGNPIYGQIPVLTNYELYEVIDGKNKFIREAETAGVTSVTVEPGTTRQFIARLFVLDSEGNKVYTEYSDELVLDGGLEDKKPEISLASTGFNNNSNAFQYEIYLKNSDEFVYKYGNKIFVGDDPDGNPHYDYEFFKPIITNVELYKKVNDAYKYIKTISWQKPGDKIDYEISVGEKVELAIRVYVLNSGGERIYSKYSDVVIIDKSNVELAKPVLSVKNLRLDSELYGEIYFENAKEYQSDKNEYSYNLSGWELYKFTNENYGEIVDINGIKYVKFSSVPEDGEGFEYHGMVPSGTVNNEGKIPYSLVARVFITKPDGTRIYSEYSDPLSVTYDSNGNFMVTTTNKPEKPEVIYTAEKITNNTTLPDTYDCENKECVYTYEKIDSYQYTNSNGYYTINGVEFYEKGEYENVEPTLINGEKYINTDKINYTIHGVQFGKPMDFPDVLPMTYAVRTYVLGINGERIYSDPAIININSYEEYSKSVYNDHLKDTLGQLAYTLSDVDGDGQQELILRGPFSKKVGSGIAYKIIRYENGSTYLYKNIEREEIDLVGYDNYLNYKVYQNNDNSLMFVNGINPGNYLEQEVDKITFNNDGTLNEERTFTSLPIGSELLKGDTLLKFYALNDKEYLKNTITDSQILSKYEELIDLHFNNFTYAYTDINDDGIQELILKTLYGKDLNVNYQVHTYEFDEGDGTGYYMHNVFYNTNENNEIFAPLPIEQYLYKNNDSSLMFVYKSNNTEEETKLYSLNDEHILVNVGEGTHEIINGELSKGDHLITFSSYINEDKGC